jgi:hypothetical protein
MESESEEDEGSEERKTPRKGAPKKPIDDLALARKNSILKKCKLYAR